MVSSWVNGDVVFVFVSCSDFRHSALCASPMWFASAIPCKFLLLGASLLFRRGRRISQTSRFGICVRLIICCFVLEV